MKKNLLSAALGFVLSLSTGASAQDYTHARVVSDALPSDSITALNSKVGTIRLLRSGQDKRPPGKHRRYSEATVSTEDLRRIYELAGRADVVPEGHTMDLHTTLVTGDTDRHMDVKVSGDVVDDEEDIIIMFLEDVPGAYFQVGEDKIPVEANKMVFFKGNRVLHHTVVPRGREVRLLGPFASRDLQDVTAATCDNGFCPTVEFEKDDSCCDGGRPTDTTPCNPDTTTAGDCCVDDRTIDGLCGLTNGSADNNCDTTRTMRAIACPTDSPTKGPTSSPTSSPTSPTSSPTTRLPTSSPTTRLPTSSPTTRPTTTSPTPAPTCKKPDVTCKLGVCFDAVAKNDCPSGHHYLYEVQHKCTSHVEMGQLCQSSGECGTDQHVADNCKYGFHALSITLDVYRRVECCDDA